jgi:phosphatidylinositol alpha-1,6-mannosyltransferase
VSKTLLITNDFPPDVGGIQSYLSDLVECFNKKDIIIYASSPKIFKSDFDKKFGYKIIRDKRKLLLPKKYLEKKIIKLIAKHNITTVWFGSSLPLGLMSKYIKKHCPNINIICSTHGHEVWWAKFLQIFYKNIVKHSDTVTYISDYTFSKLKKHLTSFEKKKFVKNSPSIKPPISMASSYANILQKYGEYILCVSRLTPRKGQDTLIKCMPFINKYFPSTNLIIAGSGSYEKHLKKIANNNKSIIFTGEVSNNMKNELLKNCKIFAMPCRNRHFNLEVEGLGIVFLEASLYKKPIIVGNSGGAPETVIDNKTGILTNNKNEVKNALIKLLSSDVLCKEFGENGYNYVNANWTVDKRYKILQQYLR